MKNSAIEWTDHTFNPWIGCTKVSPGCAHCYAEARDQRFAGGKHWGKGAPRERTLAANWKQPVKWNKRADLGLFIQCDGCGRREFRKWDGALPPGGLSCCSTHECLALPESEANPVTPRVFCASLADWLDDEVPIEWTTDLLDLIRKTKRLDWQLLTKRPENWAPRMKAVMDHLSNNGAPDAQDDLWNWLVRWTGGEPPSHVWIGTTVEDQQRAYERIPELLKIPAKVRFLSCEPLLGPVKLTHNVDWVICGGESGPHARPMHPDWARSLRDQCRVAGVPFFFKQWGEWIHDSGLPADAPVTWPADKYHSATHSWRVGKHAAGRLLDGREHNAFPAS